MVSIRRKLVTLMFACKVEKKAEKTEIEKHRKLFLSRLIDERHLGIYFFVGIKSH